MKAIEVLVVDSNQQLLRLVAMWLETLPAVSRVTCVSSANEALEYLSRNAPHLALINWRMETANGANVHTHLKAHPSAACHVLLTDRGLLNPAADEIARAANLGVEKRHLFKELPRFMSARFQRWRDRCRGCAMHLLCA